ncbi:MAG: hypothetical protein ACK4OP_11835 [Gemmobacter sp.]
MTGDGAHDGFLPLADAAARLGLSRLKLREAIAKGLVAARRDNEGRLRVDLTAVPGDLRAAIAATPGDPAALMGALFDEIEELSGDLADTRAANDRLIRLAGGQADALDRALAAVEARAGERDALASVADRALAAADEAAGRATAVQQVADAAFAALDRAAGALERQAAETARLKEQAASQAEAIAGHEGRLDRLFALSEQALEAAAKARAAPSIIARVFGRR